MSEDAGPASIRSRIGLDLAPRPELRQPFWFGPADRPLFGWYQPAVGAATNVGVVLCNPFGHEALAAHRSYVHLARELALAGFPSVSFDYDGTGDSAGDPQDPKRLEAWVGSISAARRALRERSGVERTVVLGTRLGALLALEEATTSPVEGLILFAPPVSGRAWVREMRALQLVRDGGEERESAVVGFALNEAARVELGRLTPRELTVKPADYVLVIPRDDLPSGETALEHALKSVGAVATLAAVPGYAAMMPEDPIKAVIPQRVFETIVSWIRSTFEVVPVTRRAGGSTPPASARQRPDAAAVVDAGVREEAVQIGNLFGILSEPAQPNPREQTAIVLFNIGVNHHVGSNRMYVALARHVARLGFRCLRLDLSGIGDSPAPRGGRENEVYSKRFFSDASAALDFLQVRGVRRFALAGLCSGAYVAYHTAVADPRVSGIVLINLLTFHWQEGDSLEIRGRNSAKSTLFYRRALLQPNTWLRVARGDVNTGLVARTLLKAVARRVNREARAVTARIAGSVAETTDIALGFSSLLTRGVRCLLIYGAQDGGIDVIEEHLGPEARDMRGRDGFEMKVLEGPDHTFTPLWAQRRLIDLVTSHLLAAHTAEGQTGAPGADSDGANGAARADA